MVGLSVLAGIGLSRASHLKSLDSERTKVAALAGEYAVDFTSLDYRRITAQVAATKKFATPTFAANYQKFTQLFAPLVVQKQLVMTTSLRRVGIASITRTSAVAVVALNRVVSTSTSTTGTTGLLRVQISLSRVSGHWLANNLTQI